MLEPTVVIITNFDSGHSVRMLEKLNMTARLRRAVSYASALTFVAVVALSTIVHDQHAHQAIAAVTSHDQSISVASMGFDPQVQHHWPT